MSPERPPQLRVRAACRSQAILRAGDAVCVCRPDVSDEPRAEFPRAPVPSQRHLDHWLGLSVARGGEPPHARRKFTGGCSSPPGSLVLLIDQNGRETDSLFPCFDRPSITDLLQARGLSWRYYQSHPRAGLWNGPDAIRHIQESHDYHDHVVLPPARVLKDIAKGRLADVSWVTPTSDASDHAGGTDGDARSDDLSDCFNFSQRPRRFTTIDAPLRADYFLRHADSTQDPDDDR